jgi:cytochrome c oxidase subunit II
MTGFNPLPPQASTMAVQVDALFYVLLGLSIFFILLIAGLILYFGLRYREGSKADRSGKRDGNLRLEFFWAAVPFVISLGVFYWAGSLFFTDHSPPPDTIDIYVVGKQWMWKVEHTNGYREINEVHVPVGRPVRLIMSSQDVIHSFYVPAFRIKQDVVPGRTTELWFQPTKPGTYHLFCAEYCGMGHSAMIGDIVVMTQVDYETWLNLGGAEAQAGMSPGEQLATQLGCLSCHKMDGSGVGPSWSGLFGSQVTLESGQTVTADEAYIKQSIRDPMSQIVAGYQPVMPDFDGQINDTQLTDLIDYIKSLAQPQ